MQLRPDKRILSRLLCACLIALAAVAAILGALRSPLQADAQTATQILMHRFPYTDASPLQTKLAALADTLFGFNPTAPASILQNQFAFCAIKPQAQPEAQPTTPAPTQAEKATPENTLPIAETSQTVAALKNTEGKNKQIYVDNDTSYSVDIATLLAEPLSLSVSADAPSVLIVHTHTTESYTPEGQTHYALSDSTRTQDKALNVVRVGDEIARTLTGLGIHVLHDTTINDYPSYNGSYTKTLGIIEWYLARYPTIQAVIDVHRDGMTRSDGTKLKLTADIGGEKAAQVMLVIGTNEGGLFHDGWRENLKLGLRVQDKLTAMYPSLARPLNLRKERFNQHATPGSMIVEVGTDGNTLTEAVTAGRYFATALAEALKP